MAGAPRRKDNGVVNTTTKIGLGIGSLLVVAVIVALALGQGGLRTYPADSPEATMQGFLQHLFADEIREAREDLAPAAAARCDVGALRYTPASYHDAARIDDVELDGTTALVTVVFVDDSGLFDEPYESTYEFGMEQIDGVWRIADLDERFGCR